MRCLRLSLLTFCFISYNSMYFSVPVAVANLLIRALWKLSVDATQDETLDLISVATLKLNIRIAVLHCHID